MFWQEIQMTSSPINTLLEKENVTLTELLDEDDILQECKTLNKQLVEFLARPNTIRELIQLIVEEPPSNMDLRQQYRNSAMACEIIASRVPTLSENIAGDPKILGKLYSFLDSKSPLNPLLASFFAKTIEVLFTHSAAHQDWYTYQLMCLQVIEFFKSCPDFLPKILEHIGTSGIMNSLQYITQVPVDEMKNNILTWLDSQNLIEKLIALICGTYTTTYVKEGAIDADIPNDAVVNLDIANSNQASEETPEPKADSSDSVAVEGSKPLEESKHIEEPKVLEEFKAAQGSTTAETVVESNAVVPEDVVSNGPVEMKNNLDELLPPIAADKLDERLLTSRSANASQLICNFISKGREPNTDLGHKFYNPLLAKCLSAEIINQLLESIFNSPENNRKNSIYNGIQVLLTLLNDETGQIQQPIVKQEEIHRIAEIVTPWLPQFVNILKDPPILPNGLTKDQAVGAARLTVAHLLVVMVDTDSPAVTAAIMEHQVFTLLLDMFFQFQWNNFLHAHVESIIEKALNAPSQKEIYKKHLFTDCKLIKKIYTAWDENVKPDKARPGYMGHMIQIANHMKHAICSDISCDATAVPDLDLWEKLLERLNEINTLYSTCLGGFHPADNNLQGIQPSQQECYTSEYLHHDINFNDGDDIITDTDTMGELPDSSEQMFSSMCENTSSSFGGNNVADHWTHANIQNLTGENILEDNGNENAEEKTTATLGELEDGAYFAHLLNNYTEYETMNAFNKWLRNNDCPDWIDDNGSNPVTAPIPTITENNSSPWGDMGNLSNEQSGWADFGNLQETAGISNVPNTFTCEAFAAFDQENVPTLKEGDIKEPPLPELETPILGNPKMKVDGSTKNEMVNVHDTKRFEQIQSETSNDTIISVSGRTPSFADIVQQQPGAQKVVVNILSEPAASEESTPAIGVTDVLDVPDDASKPPAVDLEALSQSLASVCIVEKVPAVATSVVDVPAGAETGSQVVQNSITDNVDQDTSVDNLR